MPHLDSLLQEVIRENLDRDETVREFKRRALLDEECKRELRRSIIISRLLHRCTVIAALLDAANRATS